MSPETSALDRALARSGQEVTLQRMQTVGAIQSVAAAVTLLALVRGYNPREFVNGVTQTDSVVIFSPTPIIAIGWESALIGVQDRRIPVKGNRCFITGRSRIVEVAMGVYLNEKLVRIEMRVLG